MICEKTHVAIAAVTKCPVRVSQPNNVAFPSQRQASHPSIANQGRKWIQSVVSTHPSIRFSAGQSCAVEHNPCTGWIIARHWVLRFPEAPTPQVIPRSAIQLVAGEGAGL